MGILNLRIKKMEGDVGEQVAGELKVSSSLPKIKDITEREIGIGGSKTKVLVMGFDYKVKYEPIKAKINIEGELLFTDSNQKDILNKWKKDKKIDEKYAMPVLNFIIKKCAIQSIKIADELQLPAPVRLPELVKK